MVKTGQGGNSVDNEKVLKISWEKVGKVLYYSLGIFGKFGKVEHVVIKSSKKRLALLVMASKRKV